MRLLFYILFIFQTIGFVWTQEIEPEYKKMIEKKYDFPTINPDSLEANLSNVDYVILDTRERDEYTVSHIPGALRFGYDNPNYDLLKDIDTSKTIVLYCSIGVRSEKIGETLEDKGFNSVFNLYGGIFLWADQNRPMETVENDKTTEVHGYNRFWGRWVKKAPVVYE